MVLGVQRVDDAFPCFHFPDGRLRPESLRPNLHQRPPIQPVCGFQCQKVSLLLTIRFSCQHDFRQIKAAQQFHEKKTDGASVEVTEGMDRQEAALSKGQQLKHQITRADKGTGPACLEIQGIFAHEHC